VGFEDRQALALGSITAGRVPVGGEGGFIEHDRPAQFFAGNSSVPSLAGFDQIRPLLLAGITVFFNIETQPAKGPPHGQRGCVDTQLISQLASIHSGILGNQFAQILFLVLGETELGSSFLLLEDHQGTCFPKSFHHLGDEPLTYRKSPGGLAVGFSSLAGIKNPDLQIH